MSTQHSARSKGFRFWLFAGFVVVFLLIVGAVGVQIAGANNFGGAFCPGTYLVDLGVSEALWTFSLDGTVQVTDSAMEYFGFTHEHGAWVPTGPRAVKATWLNFSLDPDSALPAGYARIFAELTFAGNCRSLSGTQDLWLFGPDEDPLDRTSGTLEREGTPFTGRRVLP